MPAKDIGPQVPEKAGPRSPPQQIHAIADYIASLGGGADHPVGRPGEPGWRQYRHSARAGFITDGVRRFNFDGAGGRPHRRKVRTLAEPVPPPPRSTRPC